MNKRIFLYIALIFIISLLSFSAVSANEDISSDNLILDENVYDEKIILDDVQDKNILSENDYGDVIPVGNADEKAILAENDEELTLDKNNSENIAYDGNNQKKLSDRNTYSFRQLYDTIRYADTELNLTDNYQYTADDGDNFRYGIWITKSLTINGNGVTINASDRGRIFIIRGDNVTINNITFANGNKDLGNNGVDYGGAIRWEGANGCITNSNFINNHAIEYGGAICWAGENGTVTNCSFSNNYVNENNAYHQRGGAIYWTGANGNVTYSNFTDNFALNYGGAITWYGGNGNVRYCSFSNNNAGTSDSSNSNTKRGGAIYWNAADGTVSDSNFTHNTANEFGGAIYWEGGNGNVSYSNFIDNEASNYLGGAIAWDGANGNVLYSAFYNNRANGYSGGAIRWGAQYGNISGCLFVNSTAFYAGSVYNNGVSVPNTYFNNNILLNNGADEIHISFFEGSIADYNWFGNNESNYNVKPEGCIGNVWLFLNGTANPNPVSSSGSSEIIYKLYAYDGTNVQEYDNELLYPYILSLSSSNGKADETAVLGEAAIFNPQNTGTATVTAEAEGTYTQTVSLNVGPSSFSDLNRTINGNEDAEITLKDYYEFDPETDGAFIHGIIINRTVTINGNGTTINGSGKARIFQVIADNVTLNNITFTNGNASGEGADRSGGAIRWEGENGIISYSNFTFNHAYLTGGAIIWSGENGTVKHSSFSQNDADASYGGAIRWGGAKGTITDSDFYLNSATDAGAIWWLGANGTVKYSNLINNHADARGGAIRWMGENGTVTYSNFSLNNGGRGSWYDGGGAIFWDDKNGTVTYSNFSNNHINGHGGAIAWDEQYGNVSSCLFVNNTATDGASVYHNEHLESYSNFNNNILLNNGENEIHFDNFTGSNADNNWLGQNSSNYNDNPTGLDGNAWLFLNGTANPNIVINLASSEVLYKLYSYDGSEVREYDNALLYPIILALSSSSGSINETVGLGEKAIFTPESLGNATVTAEAEGTYTQTVSIRSLDERDVENSFLDLNRAINGNEDTEITLEKNYTYNPEIDDEFINGVVINRAVTINGNGNTINGLDQARIFQVIGPDVIINNISFTNGYANGNSDADKNGGAIYWSGENGVVRYSTFTNNNASSGGAIAWTGGNGKVSYSNFTDNNASSGGAIAWTGQYGDVYSCLFVNNTATDGASVYHNDRAGQSYSNFNNNILFNNGENEIYFDVYEGSNANNNWFGQNSSNYNDSPTGLDGNAWLFLNGTASPKIIPISESSEIRYELYSYDGTVVREYDNGLLYPIILTLSASSGSIVETIGLGENVIFTPQDIGNATVTAELEGICTQTVSIKALDESYFDNSFWDLNKTINGNEDSEISLEKNYTYNPEIDELFIDGVVINRTVTINGNGNTISGLGQARIFQVLGSDVIINNITFTNGNASYGGAIYWDGENGNIGYSNFTNNNATWGGAIRWEGANGNIENSHFADSNARYGGVIYWDGENGNICYSNFTNNSAEYYGGAIYWVGYNGNVEYSDFSNNLLFGHHDTYMLGGGAILWDAENGNVKYSNFSNNIACDFGGAIMWFSKEGNVEYSDFSNNTADVGGAIYWSGDDGDIQYSNFSNNNASAGGAILCEGQYVYIISSNFTNNSADYGGAIYGWWSYYIDVTYSDFSNNNASYGGAIFLDETYYISFEHSSFFNNHADEIGGAIYDYGEKDAVYDCLFVNNTADNGASVYHNEYDSDPYSYFYYNILLNNGDNETYFYVFDESEVYFNWYGQNSSNYEEKGIGRYDNVWLFINATVNPDRISISNSSEISYRLYCYDGTEVGEYQGTYVLLNLSSSGGNINETVWLEEKAIFTPSDIGNITVTAKVEGIEVQTVTIDVYPESFSDLNRTINGNDDDEISLAKYYAYNPETDSAFINGIIINRTVTINGNGSTINGSDKARIFQVIASDVVLNNITFANGNANGDNEDGYGGAILWEGDNGRVEDSTFINNNASGYGGAIFGGNCSDNVIFQNNHAGIEGDDWYVPKPVISVNDFTSTYKSGENLYVNVSYLGSKIDGINVTISVFDSSNQLIGNYSCLSGDGWTVDLDAGNYNALVFVDSDEYGYGEETIALTINKRASQISANPLNTTYNGNENIIMILKDNYNESIANATVLVDFNGEKNLTTDENGQIIVSTNGIVPGEYWAQFIFDGSKNYEESDEKVKVIISKASTSLSSENMNVSYNESKYLIATLKDKDSNPLAEISIEFKSNSSTVKNENTDNKGQAKLLIDFNPGTYNIDISFAGNSLYDASYATVTVVVNPSDDSGNGTEPSGNGSSGNGTSPEGNGTSPSGNGTSPSGNGTSPSGNGTSPGGNGTDPSGNGTSPSGNGTSPGGNGTDPSGNGTSPSGNGTSPGGNGTDPSGNGTSPGGNGTDPGGNGTSPTVKDTLIGISTSTVIYGNDELINLTLTTADKTPIDGVIELKLGNSIYNVTIIDGKGSKALSNLAIGNYTVTADYKGDSEYNSSTASSSFTVRDRIETRIIYNNMTTAPVGANDGRIGNYFRVKLVDENNQALAGVPIQIGFNGRIYNRTTDSEGGAKLQINLAKEDGYTFAICFKGDDDYNASFEVAKIDVNKKYPKPNSANSESAEPANKTQKNTRLETSILYKDMKTESVLKAEGRAGKYFEIQLVDNNKKALAGVPIKIGFNGVVYDRITNATGGAKLQINLLKVTQYTFAIAYLGDSKYQSSFEVAKITVNKQTPKITAPQKTFKAKAKTKTVTATLKSQRGALLSGKKIKFTVNGKTYTGTTNSKGVASVKVSLSKKGTYTATAKFDGDANTKATSVKFKVKIS